MEDDKKDRAARHVAELMGVALSTLQKHLVSQGVSNGDAEIETVWAWFDACPLNMDQEQIVTHTMMALQRNFGVDQINQLLDFACSMITLGVNAGVLKDTDASYVLNYSDGVAKWQRAEKSGVVLFGHDPGDLSPEALEALMLVAAELSGENDRPSLMN